MTRRFTTADLEKLIQDTDDGPWDFAAEYGEVASQYGPVAQDVADHNFQLVTASPELAAELLRVRRALERLADGAYTEANKYYFIGGTPEDELGSENQHYYEEITRILNGDTNE